jgi:hypothetical protein
MLKDMLAQVSEQTEAKQSVKVWSGWCSLYECWLIEHGVQFQRRKMDSDDEDDE